MKIIIECSEDEFDTLQGKIPFNSTYNRAIVKRELRASRTERDDLILSCISDEFKRTKDIFDLAKQLGYKESERTFRRDLYRLSGDDIIKCKIHRGGKQGCFSEWSKE